jgi:hypothetical protein
VAAEERKSQRHEQGENRRQTPWPGLEAEQGRADEACWNEIIIGNFM